MAGKRSAGTGLVVAVVVIGVLISQAHDGGDRRHDSGPSAGPSPTRQGKPARPGPVLAVKIDNAAAARPQTGVDQADVVYVERVEAGLTRLMAVYSSRFPDSVGPVRSARETDLELLRQYRGPVLAYSGAQTRLKPAIARAPVRAYPPEKLGGAYVRSTAKAAPHNLYLRPGRVLAKVPELRTPQDLGFAFGPAPAGGKAAAERSVRYPAARFTFTWSARHHRWQVAMDGRTAPSLAPATIVLQRVTVRKGAYGDRWGNNSPFTETTGRGTATVLRDGEAYAARWSRPAATDVTTFTRPGGKPLPFAKGQVWVVYVPR